METPLTISSSGLQAVTISSDGGPVIAAPVVQVDSSIAEGGAPSTIEHIQSSDTPRSSASSDLALLEAREECGYAAVYMVMQGHRWSARSCPCPFYR